MNCEAIHGLSVEFVDFGLFAQVLLAQDRAQSVDDGIDLPLVDEIDSEQFADVDDTLDFKVAQ